MHVSWQHYNVYMLIISAKLNALSLMKAPIKHTNNLQRALLSMIVLHYGVKMKTRTALMDSCVLFHLNKLQAS